MSIQLAEEPRQTTEVKSAQHYGGKVYGKQVTAIWPGQHCGQLPPQRPTALCTSVHVRVQGHHARAHTASPAKVIIQT